MAGDPGHALGNWRPPRLQPAPVDEPQHPLRRRHRGQDGGDVAGVDVFSLQAPIQSHHQQRRITARCHGCGVGWVGAWVGVDGELGRGMAQALQWRDHLPRLRPCVGGAVIPQVGLHRQPADHS